MRVTFAGAALLGTVAAAALVTTPAFAQENPGTDQQPTNNQQTQAVAAEASSQEIVVTARRRNELLLNVPVAVTAYSGEQLNRQGALDLTDVADTTPNVTLEVSRGTNSTLTPFIRGIGQQDPVAGFEQGVGLYLDDVYLNRPQAAVLDIYDVERIEVLRGPQGTLYGRNTIGGAIKYVTRRIRTDGPHAMVRTNVGTHGQFDAIAQVSTPLTQGLRVGAAIARLSNTGFGRNLTTGDRNYNKNVWAARGTVELEPAPDVFFRLSGDYSWDNSNPRGGHRLIPNLVTGELPLSNVFDSEGGLNDPEQRVRSGGVALHGEIGLNDWLQFRTITAYRKDRSDTPIDFDATPAVDVDVPAIYKNHQFSQEFQLVADKGPLQGVAGLYYLNASAFDIFDVRLYTSLPTILPGLTAATVGDVKTKTWAAFTDLTYNFSDQWAASAGLRYTSDRRHARVFRRNLILGGSPELGGSDPFDATGVQVGAATSDFEGSRKDKALTPRLSVNFKPTPNHNLYISYSKGFKGGGFDPRALSTQAPSQSPDDIYDFMAFDPEKVDSYEIGWKASLFDRRLQLATAIFDAEYKDVQVPGSEGCVVNGVATFCGVTTNAGKARFRGVEVEANARLAEDFATPGDRLNLAGTLGYLDAKYLHFITNIPGQGPVDVADFRKIQNTPKWTMSGSLDYQTPLADGRLDLNSTISYRSKSQQFETAIPGLDQGGFALWDANLIWRSAGNRYEVGLHGKNLLNKKYIVAGYNFLAQNPFTGEFLLGTNGLPVPTLGKTGVLTAYYGNPRQVFLSAAINF
ncbi:TonB-dependent receptor [Sphingomonas segetis]|uniref:TonB-dependent receptor n=1 Tax=Sphingomonas segetis TaxID=1104779 RepID=UPI0012D2AA6D|nr:TonB-dependent receptor [Sphingomonas segetis]